MPTAALLHHHHCAPTISPTPLHFPSGRLARPPSLHFRATHPTSPLPPVPPRHHPHHTPLSTSTLFPPLIPIPFPPPHSPVHPFSIFVPSPLPLAPPLLPGLLQRTASRFFILGTFVWPFSRHYVDISNITIQSPRPLQPIIEPHLRPMSNRSAKTITTPTQMGPTQHPHQTQTCQTHSAIQTGVFGKSTETKKLTVHEITNATLCFAS